MGMIAMKQASLKHWVLIGAMALAGCSEISYSLNGKKIVTDPSDPNYVDPAKLFCDPLDPKNTEISATSGIKAAIRYIDYKDGDPQPVSSSAGFLTKGKLVDGEAYFSSLEVTERDFAQGFSSGSGEKLKKDNGETLVEWFSIEGESQLRLAAGQPEGDYQLGAITDDGITFAVRDASGNWSTLFENDNAHSASMACASRTVHLKPGEPLPMRFRYYQGPRVRIALYLMWRKVDASAIPAESECNVNRGSSYFFDVSKLDSDPEKAPFKALKTRGWSAVKPANFVLLNAVNKCATATN